MGQSISERVAVEILHDEEVHDLVAVALLSNIVERADVRMLERGDRARFALEPCLELRVGSEPGRQYFDRDDAIEACVASALDLAHAAPAHERDGFVRTEPSSGREWHGSEDLHQAFRRMVPADHRTSEREHQRSAGGEPCVCDRGGQSSVFAPCTPPRLLL